MTRAGGRVYVVGKGDGALPICRQQENSCGMLETECPDALASALAPENK